MTLGVTRRIRGSEEQLAAYFNAVKERLISLQRAQNYMPEPIVLNFAGKRVGVVFGSQAIEDTLMPSLASQRVSGQTSDAGCLYFWQDWPGNYCPAIENDDFEEEVWRHESETAKIFIPIRKNYYIAWHYAHGDFFHCLPATNCLQSIHTTCPLRRQLHVWAQHQGLLFLHGAAVEIDGCGIFIGAPGGSGKSTLAVACLLAGHSFVSDDYVLLDCHNVAHMVSATAYLHTDMLARMPDLRQRVIGQDATRNNKTLLDLSDYAHAHKPKIALTIIIIPKVGNNGTPSISRINPARPLWEIVRTTAEQNGAPHDRAFISNAFTRLASLPVYEFLLSSDITRNVQVLETFVAKRKTLCTV